MALKYKIVSTYSPGEGKKGKQLWFPKITGSSQINLREIAKILHKRSTASESDVYLIVKGLVDLIPELLADGYTVKLDELGTFRLHTKVNTSDSPESVSEKNINKLRLSFRPDNFIKEGFKNIKIEPDKSK
ncbi:HU family DNA-binding protein [Natronoflexus pectinivorans]|uniref:Putative histone-like DNA-binding protein n=1 Tax=Natronoflexus pectinivorans TaxID=682526 RepID=A0A4R2GL04_9BACT|nr:HU family DNA-binding protein [Natronoflexus pectinivorans]TCO09379.1 putative histone-like DNA-binding protein [Natronoflexus pectinivorans]